MPYKTYLETTQGRKMLFTDKSRLSGQPGERARVGRFFCAFKNSLKIFVQILAR